MKLIPSVEEERWQAVAELAGASDLTRARGGGWRSFSILARIGFFFVGAVSALALWGVCAIFSDSPRGAAFVAGAFCIGAAEFLIVARHWFRAGIDEALYAAATFMMAMALVTNYSDRSIVVIFGIAALIVAVRLLHPIFSVVAALLFAGALPADLSPWACAVMAVVALAMLPIRYRRPSHDRIVAAFVIVMPLAAYVFAKDRTFDHFEWRIAASLLIFAAGSVAIGLRFRLHAPLLSLFLILGAFAYEMRDVSGLALETRLIVWGSVLLAVAVLLERWLRTPRYGVTSEKLRDDNVFGLLELAGAAILTPTAKQPDAGPQLQAGGGAYGGGGASGDF